MLFQKHYDCPGEVSIRESRKLKHQTVWIMKVTKRHAFRKLQRNSQKLAWKSLRGMVQGSGHVWLDHTLQGVYNKQVFLRTFHNKQPCPTHWRRPQTGVTTLVTSQCDTQRTESQVKLHLPQSYFPTSFLVTQQIESGAHLEIQGRVRYYRKTSKEVRSGKKLR